MWVRATLSQFAPATRQQSLSTPARSRVPSTDASDSLGIEQVPLLVLTHFHADHVDGLPGVLDGREVGHVLVSPLDDPANSPTTWRAVNCPRARAGRGHWAGDQITVGDAVRLRVLWPRRIIAAGSMANNASVVLAADVDGVRIVLAGDVEPEASAHCSPQSPASAPTCSRFRTMVRHTRTPVCFEASAPGSH